MRMKSARLQRPICSSEDQLKPELDQPRSARPEPHIILRHIWRTVERAEVGGRFHIARQSEGRMIEDVKELGTKLEIAAFRDASVLDYREIEIVKSRPSHHVAARVPERQRGVGGESAQVEPVRDVVRTTIRIAARIGPVVSFTRAAVVQTREHREWLSGLQSEDAGKLPAAGKTLGAGAIPAVKRKLPDE